MDEGQRDDGYCPVCNDKNWEMWERKMRKELDQKAELKEKARQHEEQLAAAAVRDRQRAAAADAAGGGSAKEAPSVTFEYSNGDVYVGQMADGEPCGRGTMTYSDDGSDRLESSLTTYEGEWRGGKHNGHGTKDWGDGLRYVGEFVDGRMHGEGSYTLEDGYVMEGRFEADEFMGDMS